MRRGIVALGVGAIALLAGCARSNEEASRLQGRAEATATIDRKEVAFGDDLTLTLEVRSDPAFEIELPRTTEVDGFRLIDSGSTRSESNGVLVERRWLRLRAERAGPQTLPALEVRYRPAPAAGSKADATSGTTVKGGGGDWKTVSTAPISFEVRSLLPASDQPPEIREIKPLQPIHRARPWLWIAGAIALVLGLAAALAYWWKARRAQEETAPQAPAGARSRDRAGGARPPGRHRAGGGCRGAPLLLRAVGDRPRLHRGTVRPQRDRSHQRGDRGVARSSRPSRRSSPRPARVPRRHRRA